MIEQRLLIVAENLCRKTGRRPREAFMRRAVSTAYYAVFHALARMCADELIGGSKAKGQAWSRVYRALDHRTAKQTLLSGDAALISPAITEIGRIFANLQEKRHEADYDPAFFEFFFDETRAQVEIARQAVKDLAGLEPGKRQALATLLLFKPRGTGARS
jgi:hypothetical protein